MLENQKLICAEDFLLAAEQGNFETVRLYVEQGGNVEVKSIHGEFTALINACAENRFEIVKYLVEEVKVNLESTDKYGFTALIESSRFGNIQMVEYLIESGADINKKNFRNKSALDCALSNKHFQVAELLKNPNKILLKKKLNIRNSTSIIKNSHVF